MKTTNRLRALSFWVTLGLLISMSVSVAMTQDDAGLDPVIVDVVEMLIAGVDEGVIVQWLESTARHPTDITGQEIIALSDAGASEQLISTLLQRFEEGESGTSGVTPPASNGPVQATFHLRAKRAFTEEPEPDWQPEEPWDVYLYLDGLLVAGTRPSLEGEPVENRRVLDPGRHELRVVLQRYEDLRGGWFYESLSVPTLIAFDVQSGIPIEIEVEMKRIWGLWRERKDGGPLTYVIRQGSEILVEHQGTGGNPDRWQPVCEDVEANFADSQDPPKRFRNAMSRCIRWFELWTEAGRSTSRGDILVALAEVDFRPSVR